MVPALTSLAEQINREHAACEAAVRTGLQHALNCGRLLIEAKTKCEHGQWQPWLAANFRASERTAQGYMRVAKRLPELEEKAKAQHVALLSYRDALDLLAEPEIDERKARLHELEGQIRNTNEWARDMVTQVDDVLAMPDDPNDPLDEADLAFLQGEQVVDLRSTSSICDRRCQNASFIESRTGYTAPRDVWKHKPTKKPRESLRTLHRESGKTAAEFGEDIKEKSPRLYKLLDN